MMIMMMTMIIRESVVRARDVLEKTAQSKALVVLKTELTLLRSAWPPAVSTVTLKIIHAESVKFFLRNFSSYNFRIFFATKKIDAQGELIRVKNRIFSRKRRTKGCFLLTHNLKSKKVSVRDKFLPDVQFAPPL